MNKEYSWKYFQVNRGKNIVFDSTEVPFLRPLPELSDLGENTSIAKKFNKSWPAITFNKTCLVDGAVLIQDIAPDAELTQSVKKLNEISNITLQVVDGFNLTKDLAILIKKNNYLDENPIIIYPGNGSQSVKDFITSFDDRFSKNAIDLPTERTMIKNGEFKLVIDYSSLPQSIDTKMALIIDDVVASGQTAQSIALEIKAKFPEIACVLATWLLLIPTKLENMNSASGIDGVDQTVASIVLKGNINARPPINSLSCFRRNENKYEEMKNNFIKKYISDFNEFKKIVDKL